MIIPYGNHVTSIRTIGDLTGVCHTVDVVYLRSQRQQFKCLPEVKGVLDLYK